MIEEMQLYRSEGKRTTYVKLGQKILAITDGGSASFVPAIPEPTAPALVSDDNKGKTPTNVRKTFEIIALIAKELKL